MKWFNVVLLVTLILTACAPSDSAIQTAIAETQRAIPIPSSTLVSVPATETFTPLPLPTLTVAITSTITSTSTPLLLEIVDTKGAIMHLVPEGEFTMGFSAEEAYQFCTLFHEYVIAGKCYKDNYLHEEPIHKVYLSDFYLDVYEVSNADYEKCVTERACDPPLHDNSNQYSKYYGSEYFTNYPVINVNWEMADAYCEWRGGRLPTEAEWEKAARGIDQRTHPWGSYNISYDLFDPKFYQNKANVYVGSRNLGRQKDTVVVDYNPAGLSPYGIYNMAGNVAEWVADWYTADYYSMSPLNNPQGPNAGIYKVARGGSYFNYEIRTTARFAFNPTDYTIYLGFRCARDATP